MILKLTREINRSTINCTIMKIWANVCVCDIGIVEQYKACCHFHYRVVWQSCYPHFIFSSELDMSVLSTSFKFSRLTSIFLSNNALWLVLANCKTSYSSSYWFILSLYRLLVTKVVNMIMIQTFWVERFYLVKNFLCINIYNYIQDMPTFFSQLLAHK